MTWRMIDGRETWEGAYPRTTFQAALVQLQDAYSSLVRLYASPKHIEDFQAGESRDLPLRGIAKNSTEEQTIAVEKGYIPVEHIPSAILRRAFADAYRPNNRFNHCLALATGILTLREAAEAFEADQIPDVGQRYLTSNPCTDRAPDIDSFIANLQKEMAQHKGQAKPAYRR